MYIQGCVVKLVKAVKCVLGIKGLLNQRFLNMAEGNNFGVITMFVCIFFYFILHLLVVVNIAQIKI